MKPTTSLSKVFPTIHQPLPLTRNQSQRLLESLKASFRTNLDREHGWLNEDQVFNNGTTSNDAALDQSRRPTDDHVRAILSNPVIKHGVGIMGTSIAPKADPMVVFDRAVERNMMTLKAAQGCLFAKYNEAMQSSAPTFTDAVESLGVSARVLSWLETEGMMKELSFVENHKFTNIFVRFIVGENKESILWSWISHLVVHDEIPNAGVKAQSLLYAMVRSKTIIHTSSGLNLDPALETIIEADKLFHDYTHHDNVIFIPWRHLSWSATVDAWKRPSPSEDLYNSYAEIANTFKRPTSLYSAHLDVHHPTNPDHYRAVKFINKRQNLIAVTKDIDTRKDPISTRVFLLAMDTAKLLSQIGKSQEAQSILELIESRQTSPV